MNYKMIRYILSALLFIEGLLLFLPMLVAVYYKESALPFLITVGILWLIAAPFLLRKPKILRIGAKEGFICVAMAWVLLSLFGALPFVFSGAIPNYIDAVFETISGFTTTGSSILRTIEGLPKGVLFWRSFTHWVGGMGILVFMLAIMPAAGRDRLIHLMRAEVPGPTKGKLVPRLKESAKILYGIYILLTITEVVILFITGLPLYDSVVTAFATAGTGGYSVMNASIAAYQNPAAEWIIGVYMVLFGINFNLFYLLLIGRVKDVLRSEELRVYLCIVAASVGIIAWNTYSVYQSLELSLRNSFFQVASIISTTGFATVDYNAWPQLSKSILMLLMLVGACAGSTAGGIKVSRIVILFKNIAREVKHILHPKSVNVVRLDRKPVEEETIKACGNFLTLYIIITVVSVLLVSINGFDLETSFSAVLACINNVGPGFGLVGPVGNFADLSMFSKLVLSVNMLLGRLEIIPFLIVCSPATWLKK